MPKLLIVFDQDQAGARTRAEELATSVRRVRFMEVEFLGFTSSSELPEHDGLIIIAPASAAAADRLRTLVPRSEMKDHRFDRVGAVSGADEDAQWAVLRVLADAGYLLAPSRSDASGEAVARVAEALAHMKHHRAPAHEHSHGHAHHHD